jgi:hypothetical protein
MRWICRREVLHNECTKSREHLIGWQVGRQAVNDTERRLEKHKHMARALNDIYTHTGRCIVVDVFGLSFGGNRHQTFKNRRRKTIALNFGLFAEELINTERSSSEGESSLLYSPVQCVQCKNT